MYNHSPGGGKVTVGTEGGGGGGAWGITTGGAGTDGVGLWFVTLGKGGAVGGDTADAWTQGELVSLEGLAELLGGAS